MACSRLSIAIYSNSEGKNDRDQDELKWGDQAFVQIGDQTAAYRLTETSF